MADDPNNTPTPITLPAPQQPTTDPISLAPPIAVQPPSPPVTEQRAFKAHTGLGDVVGKSYQDMYLDIASGREKALRSEVASTLDSSNAAQKQQQLMQLASGTGKLTPESVKPLLDPTSLINQPVDPSTVIEKGYGKAVVASLDDAALNTNSPIWKEAQFTLPNLTQNAQEEGSTMVAKREITNTYMQDIQSEMDHQSLGGEAVDYLKGLVPGYNEYNLRNLVPGGTFTEGGFLGENKYLQTRRLLGLPVDQFKPELDKIVTQLRAKSPELAMQFLQALNGQSSSDVMLSNVGTAMDISAVPGIGVLPKMVARGMTVANVTRQAVKDVVEASNVPQATKATMANAAGDAGESAVHQATSNIINDLNGSGDFAARAFDPLFSNMKIKVDVMRQNAGRFGQEGVNRIEESMWSTVNDFSDRLANLVRVDRVPELKAAEEVQRAVKEDIRQDYRGMPSKLMDVQGPYWDRVSNTWHFEHQLGTESGEFFLSPEQAAKDAELNGLIIKKPSDYAQELDRKISDLQNNLKVTPEPDADVHGLNQYFQQEKDLQDLQFKKADLAFTGSDGYEIKQQGLGFYLSKMVPHNEQSAVQRDALSKLGYDQIFDPAKNATSWTDRIMPRWAKVAAGWLRTPEEVLSGAENDQRKIATHGPNVLLEGYKAASKEIDKLPRKYWDEWSRTLDASRHIRDGEGRMGYFFQSPGELEDFYQRNFGRLPEQKETEAYFAFTRNYELDRSLRNINEYRNRARLGAESHRFELRDNQGNKAYSPFVDGMTQREFPGGDDTVAIIRNGQLERLAPANSLLPNKANKDLHDAVREGRLKVVRIYAPERRELEGTAGIGDQRVRYVITDASESKPLSFDQVGQRGGGHFDFDHDSYIKQAKVRQESFSNKIRHWYEGDTTVLAGSPIRKLNDTVVKHLNNVRELIRDGRIADAEAYNNTNLHIPWSDHHGWYTPSRTAEGKVVPPRLDLNEPFHLVPKNQSVMSLSKDAIENRYMTRDPVTGRGKTSLIDGSKSGSDAKQFKVGYNEERDVDDLHTINDVGGRNNPLLQYEPAAMVDPIPAYNRAINRLVSSTFMDDMKMYSIEHWLEQAKNFLNPSESELRSAPFHHYNNLDWKASADPIAKLNLLSAKIKIDHFIGTPSKTETFINSAIQEAVDSIYGKLGPKGALLTNSMLMATKDPLAFMRTATFHAKLGLFSIPQLFTQLMTYSNIIGISGFKHAPASMAATLMHQWSRLNADPAILAALDQRMSRFYVPGASQWRPGEWTEARNFITRQTGFNTIGGEHAFTDTPFYANVTSNGWKRTLDWGESFFREGAQNTRMAAMYTAYREFREINPLSALTRRDEETILSRAALLDHNMSRASNSALHTGILAPAGQFMAYSLRLSELMTGKRLTGIEKMRLFAVSSALYGIPLGGVGLFGFPFGDALREKATEQGWTVHDNLIKNLTMEGGPATFMAFITGGGDAAKGNWYNFSKWGPESYQVIENALNSDSTIWKVVGGAALGTAYQAVSDLKPIYNWGMSFFRPDSEQFPLTAADMTQAFRNISSVNAGFRLTAAINYGKWFSRNGNYLDDVSIPDAVFRTVTGLTSTGVADITITARAIKAQDEMNKSTASQFTQYIQRELTAANAGDYEQAEKYHKQAMAILEIGGYPIEKRGSLVAQALNQNKSLVERLREDYFLRNVPPAQRQQRQDIFQRFNEIKSGPQ